MSKPYISREVERLCDFIRITHGIVIESTRCILTYIDTIRKTYRPRHFKGHISVLVSLCRTTFFPGTMLAGFQVLVNIGIKTGIIFVIRISFILILVLVSLLTTKPFEEIGNLLVVKRIVNTLARPLESAKATLTILCTITHIRGGTNRVGFIGICGKHGIHTKRVALGQLDT